MSDIQIILTSTPTELTGRVVSGAANLPVPCTVIAFSNDKSRWLLPASRYVVSTLPRPDGVFSITGLPPGVYYAAAVRALDDGELLDPEFLSRQSRRATEVRLREGESRAVALRLD